MGLGGPRHLLAEAMPSALPKRRPPPMLARLDTQTEYVLPHAPPQPPAPPVQPAREPVVESAVNNSLPTLDPWAGVHDFHVTVRTPPASEQHGRQQPYVFDIDNNKLYIDMAIAVTFAFRVSEGTDTSQLRVSALPVYMDMQHVNTPVRRCPTHRQPELECNAGAAGFIDHVIRALHDEARYQEGGSTRERRSVVVPFEQPPGTREYRVPYIFCCMNTCVGGINRRRLVVLFTLEDSRTGEALGRQTIEVKVCKCPRRDALTDRSRGQPKRRRLQATPDPLEPPVQRRRSAGRLVIELDDELEYDHLMAVLTSLRALRRRRTPRAGAGGAPLPSLSPVTSETAGSESDGAAEVAPIPVCRQPTLPIIKREVP